MLAFAILYICCLALHCSAQSYAGSQLIIIIIRRTSSLLFKKRISRQKILLLSHFVRWHIDFKDVNMFVFASFSVSNDPSIWKITTTYHGRNPVWNFPVKFTVNEFLAKYYDIYLKVKLLSRKKFLPWNTTIGTIYIPL